MGRPQLTVGQHCQLQPFKDCADSADAEKSAKGVRHTEYPRAAFKYTVLYSSNLPVPQPRAVSSGFQRVFSNRSLVRSSRNRMFGELEPGGPQVKTACSASPPKWLVLTGIYVYVLRSRSL